MSIKQTFNSTQIVYFALLMGQIMLAVIFYFLIKDQATNEASILNYVAAFILISTISASTLVYNARKKSGANLEGSLMDRLVHFRVSTIIRWAIIEG